MSKLRVSDLSISVFLMVNLCSLLRQYTSFGTSVDVDHEDSKSAGLVGYLGHF